MTEIAIQFFFPWILTIISVYKFFFVAIRSNDKKQKPKIIMKFLALMFILLRILTKHSKFNRICLTLVAIATNRVFFVKQLKCYLNAENVIICIIDFILKATLNLNSYLCHILINLVSWFLETSTHSSKLKWVFIVCFRVMW